MVSKLYVGDLAYKVASARVMMDREFGQSNEFCFGETGYSLAPAPRRGFLARPEKAWSKIGFGNIRSSFATTPICQGITR